MPLTVKDIIELRDRGKVNPFRGLKPDFLIGPDIAEAAGLVDGQEYGGMIIKVVQPLSRLLKGRKLCQLKH